MLKNLFLSFLGLFFIFFVIDLTLDYFKNQSNTPTEGTVNQGGSLKPLPLQEEEDFNHSKDELEEQNVMLKIAKELRNKGFKTNGVAVNRSKEVMVGVKGTEEYFNEVKREIYDIVVSMLKNHEQKDYIVKIYKQKTPNKQFEDIHSELRDIVVQLQNGLEEFEVIEDIGVEYQKDITIQTTIDAKTKEGSKLAHDIQKYFIEILEITKFNEYDVIVTNKDGAIIH